MKFSKVCCMFAAASLAVGAFADARNVLISFSTEADYYADGNPVLDGEWYALCWAKDGEFDGLTLDCEPVSADERVMVLAPLAKGGHCPYVIFQVDSAVAPEGGNYFVYLLDTRSADGTAVAGATKNDAGKRVPESSLNGATASKTFTASTSIGSSISGNAAGATAVSGAWVASAVPNEKQPRITAFKVENAKVKITVSDMIPGVKYNIYMGDSPSNFNSYGLTTPKTGVEDAQFEVDPGDAKFFKVVRQPLAE